MPRIQHPYDRRHVPVLNLLACVLACNPPAPSSETGTTAAGTTSTSITTTQTSDSTPTSMATTFDASTGTSATGASATGTTGCQPAPSPTCDPPPQSMIMDFRIDGKHLFDDDSEAYEQLCTVMNAAIEAADVAINLVCTDAQQQVVVHELRVTLDPPAAAPPPLAVDDEVTLRVAIEVFFEGNTRHVALVDSEGEIALAFVGASGLAVEGVQDFYAPMAIGSAEACPKDCSAVECGFIVDECPCIRRLAVEFTVNGDTVQVLDGNLGARLDPPRYDLRVANATSHEGPEDDFGCGRWFHVLALRTP